ncbi:GAF domain-containing protein [Acetobacter estunensis]|nr:GAF domain-containing protein [Acetobacter estunensis]
MAAPEPTRAPFHMPAATTRPALARMLVQSGGCLLTFNASTLRLQRSSANSVLFLANPSLSLGADISMCIGSSAAQRICATIEEQPSSHRPVLLLGLAMGLRHIPCDVALHIVGSEFVLECFRAGAPALNGCLIGALRNALERLREPENLQGLLDVAVKQARLISEYDHILLYRFDRKERPVVVADAFRSGLTSLRGQYMTEDDLPPSIQTLYRQTLIRVIEDIEAPEIAVQESPGLPEFDTSSLMLRSVLPAGRVYLEACGIKATMLLALVVDGRLWGMLTFRHYEPRPVSMDERAIVRMFGEYVALQIAAVTRTNRLRIAEQAHDLLHHFLHSQTDIASVPRRIRLEVERFAHFVECDGVGVWMDGKWATHGHAPSVEAVPQLLEWMRESDSVGTCSTDSLHDDATELLPALPDFAGVMAIPIATGTKDCLFFFRRERERIVNLAPLGRDPQKVSGFLQEHVFGYAHPWTTEDQEAATQLRAAMMEITGAYHQFLLREQAEAERRQKLVNEELTHRVKNILAVVQSLVSRPAPENRTFREHFTTLRERINALAFAHDQIMGEQGGSSLRTLFDVELAPYQLSPEAVTLNGPDLWMEGTVLSIMTLLIHELLTNAAKYGALATNTGQLVVEWHHDRASDMWHFCWKETGGRPIRIPIRQGFGSVLLERAIRHELGGTATRDFQAEGVVIHLAVPARFLLQKPIESTQKNQPLTAPPPASSAKKITGDLKGRRVLVVEDQILIAMETEDILRDHGVSDVCTAASVSEARAFLTDMHSDIAVLDLNLGEGTSLDLAVLLRARGIPFIFATGYGNRGGIPDAFADVPLVHKPYTGSGLIKALQTACG